MSRLGICIQCKQKDMARGSGTCEEAGNSLTDSENFFALVHNCQRPAHLRSMLIRWYQDPVCGFVDGVRLVSLNPMLRQQNEMARINLLLAGRGYGDLSIVSLDLKRLSL